MIEWTSQKILELTALARGAAALGAVVMVALAYFKTRSIVTVLAAAITAGIFLFTIHRVDWWQQRVDEESDTLGRPALVVTPRLAGATARKEFPVLPEVRNIRGDRKAHSDSSTSCRLHAPEAFFEEVVEHGFEPSFEHDDGRRRAKRYGEPFESGSDVHRSRTVAEVCVVVSGDGPAIWRA